MSPAAELGLMLSTGTLAMIWVAYKAIRQESISTDRVPEQLGLLCQRGRWGGSPDAGEDDSCLPVPSENHIGAQR